MDTKVQEEIAENLVISMLLDAGILVAKPMFDQGGGDLLGFSTAGEKAQLCRIQCKYRDYSKKTNVVIHPDYVTGAFVLFIYLKRNEDHHLLCMLPTGIVQHFKEGQDGDKKVLRLTITAASAKMLIAAPALKFNQQKVTDIKALMHAASHLSELHRAFLRVMECARWAQEKREKRDRLKDVLHRYQLANLRKQAAEENMAIIQEYLGIVESQMEATQHELSKLSPAEGTQCDGEKKDATS